ncbi:MAG: DUF1553 domain-containing protein [Bacteroidia bacterium]|nr:DUF1553 domain-containing protein [Bacteroidia bacterium]
MKTHYLLLQGIGILLGACNSSYSDYSQLPDKIDFNFHVKPILSDRCYACHGPDAQKREADLRLDEYESAFASLKSGAGFAIVAGDVDESQLSHRILSTDPEFMMPPPESNLSLTEKEKAIILKWIDQGAEYKDHWAFAKPVKTEIPETANGWAINEIDHFVANKLEALNIEPAPEADREQLIRRAFFDLTGLPPRLDDLDKWMGDSREDYYERMLDSLLSLPAFGERMTAHWLDVSRFADSEGYLDDFHHTFWPYRDWVIEAYNKNLSYDKFILWQVGGDQIPNANKEQVLATAFNRNHKQNSEGGIIPEEFRVDYVADRTNTVGAAFLGLTLGCARCHDHKYDPISQKNYYELFGFFNSVNERGDGIFALNGLEYGQEVSNYYSMNAGPVLPLADEKVADIHKYLVKEVEGKRETLLTGYLNNQDRFEAWRKRQKNEQALTNALSKTTLSWFDFDRAGNGKVPGKTPRTGNATYNGELKITEGKSGKGLMAGAQGFFLAEGEHIAFERSDPFTISFWIKTPKEFEEAHILYNGNDRIQGYRGWDIMLDSTRIHFRLNHAHPYQSVDIRIPEKLPLDEWVHFVWSHDGSGKARGMKVYRNGELRESEVMRDYLYRSTKPYLKSEAEATIYRPYRGMIVGNRHYDQDFTGGVLDDLRILNKQSGALMALALYDKEKAGQVFREGLSEKEAELHEFYNLHIDEELELEREDLRQLRMKEIQTIDTVQEIMVMGDRENERVTYVLDRGVYDAHGEVVEKNVPESLLPWPEDLPKNRYGLGQWLVHPDHPLTARVAVNQFWYLMFGKGIVETVEDFGNQGALPTHPALLDYLAVDFIENGWDVKALLKKMLLSATYRQSSKIRPELIDIDPENELLARGHRYRRSAEMVRDNILAASNLLDPSIGGPSTFPYQPGGLWKEVMTHPFFPAYTVDYEHGIYRRSIYTFWKRLMPPPGMLIFDAASRVECQVRRQRSSTPLQALMLLNDEQMIEGCRAIASNMWKAYPSDVKALTRQTFRLLTSREPNEKEHAILQKQYQEELAYFADDENRANEYLEIGKMRLSEELPADELAALTRVTNTILNTTEAFYKN